MVGSECLSTIKYYHQAYKANLLLLSRPSLCILWPTHEQINGLKEACC